MSFKIPEQIKNGKIFLLNDKPKTVKEAKEPKYGEMWQTNPRVITDNVFDNVEAAGFVCSPEYAVLDIEGPEKGNKDFDKLIKIFDAYDTFSVSTPSGGRHYYFKCPNSKTKSYVPLGNKIGEWRVKDCYVIAPGSKLLDKEYKVINDVPLKEINEDTLLSNFVKQKKDEKYIDIKETKPEDRSATEYGALCAYIKKGMLKEEIWQKMTAFSKWNEDGNAYREHSYTKALEAVGIVSNPEKISNNDLLEIQDILDTPEDNRYIIEKVCYPGTVGCFVSEQSGYKTLLSIYMAMATSQGEPFFGLKTTKSNVLILDYENNRNFIKKKHSSLIAGMKYNKADLHITYLLKGKKMDDKEFLNFALPIVKEKNIKLIIVDTLIGCNTGDENTARDMRNLYDNFCKLIGDEASLIFLHHTNRQGEFRGTSDILGAVDTEFEIKRNKSEFTIHNKKNRAGEINDIQGEVFWDTENNITSIVGEIVSDEQAAIPEKEETDKFNMALRYISRYFKNSKTLDFSEVRIDHAMDLVNGKVDFSLATLKDAKTWMVKKKHIITTKRGIFVLNEPHQEKITKWINEADEYFPKEE